MHTSPTSGSQTDADSDESKPAGVIALLSIPAIRALTISGFALSFLSLAFDVVFTLFCYTPVDAGGLGFEVSTETGPLNRPDVSLLFLAFHSPRRSGTCLHSQGRLLSSSGPSPCLTSCGVLTTPKRTMHACAFGPSHLAFFHSSTSSSAPARLPDPTPSPSLSPFPPLHPCQGQCQCQDRQPHPSGQVSSFSSRSPRSVLSHTA